MIPGYNNLTSRTYITQQLVTGLAYLLGQALTRLVKPACSPTGLPRPNGSPNFELDFGHQDEKGHKKNYWLALITPNFYRNQGLGKWASNILSVFHKKEKVCTHSHINQEFGKMGVWNMGEEEVPVGGQVMEFWASQYICLSAITVMFARVVAGIATKR